MKYILERISDIKRQMGALNDTEEAKEKAQTAYTLAAQQYAKADQSAMDEDNFKSNFRFKSLHLLEYLIQDADRIIESEGIETFTAEVVTALNLMMVVLEDDSTQADLSQAG